MYELYEVVIAQRLLSEKVRKGTRGTVLMAFTEPSVGYMVEFVDNEGNSLESASPSHMRIYSHTVEYHQ